MSDAQELSLEQRLWNPTVGTPNYGSLPPVEQANLILQMYRTYLNTIHHVANRRMKANSFFLTLNTAAIAGLGTFYAYFAKAHPQQTAFVIAIGCIVGMFMCMVWRRMLRHYWNVTKAKFAVIGELERRLPASPLFAAEWHLLGDSGALRYQPLTSIELLVPNAMLFFYFAIAVTAAIWQHDVVLDKLGQ
jgi:hypothetical protein